MCGELGFSEGNCSAQLCGGADVWRGRLSWIPFKELLYDDLVGFVTSRHVTKMAVTLVYSIRHGRNLLLYENFRAPSFIEP